MYYSIPLVHEQVVYTEHDRQKITVDMVFLFLAAFVDRETGYIESAPRRRINVAYGDIRNRVLCPTTAGWWNAENFILFKSDITSIKALYINTFELLT